jgi:uncharacterized coiled-coil protein SlyX
MTEDSIRERLARLEAVQAHLTEALSTTNEALSATNKELKTTRDEVAKLNHNIAKWGAFGAGVAATVSLIWGAILGGWHLFQQVVHRVSA